MLDDTIMGKSKMFMTVGGGALGLILLLFGLSHLNFSGKPTVDFYPSHYQRFARNSQKIADGKLIEALQEAKALKQALEADEAFFASDEGYLVRKGPILFVFNQLRIALLEKEVGSPEEGKEAWEEFEKSVGWKPGGSTLKTCGPKDYVLLERALKAKAVSLKDYQY